MFSIKYFIFWLAMAAAVLVVTAQDKPSFLIKGRCSDANPTAVFDAEAFQGKWYRIAALPNTEEQSATCTKYDYVLNRGGFTVVATGKAEKGSPTSQRNTLSQQDPRVGRFSTQVTQNIEADMTVLQTDYNNYACLYSCYNFKDSFKVQFAWIISRERTLSRENIGTCQRILLQAGVPPTKLVKTLHEGCTN